MGTGGVGSYGRGSQGRGDGGVGLPCPSVPRGADCISFACRLSSFMCSSAPWIDCMGTGTWQLRSPHGSLLGPGSYRAFAVYLLSVPIDSLGSGTQALSPMGNPSASLSL